MDRAAKTLRQNHRTVGHDMNGLIQMMLLYKHKYSPMEIMKAFYLHKALDGSFSGLQAAVRKRNSGYGRKDSTIEIINKLKKELFRI